MSDKMKWFSSSKKRLVVIGFVAAVILAGGSSANAGSEPIEITVLYDNYTLHEECQSGWGFSCIITGMEKNILFDAGGDDDSSILLGNMDILQIDPETVDLLVLSHDHGDHTGGWEATGGLLSFLDRNSDVSVYLPPSVPTWDIQKLQARGITIETVSQPMQICEGVHLTGPMGSDVIEQSLVLETPKGLVVISGCAHPGIVQITRKAKDMLGKEIYMVMGGFHLNVSDSPIQSVIQQLIELGVQKVGPCHCTGDRTIELFREIYREDFVPVGVGYISIPRYGDFNGDWKVDIDDLLILIEHWGQNEPSLDIAPGLFGDGQVGRDDLEVLMSQWGHEIVDPTLLAHWKLDETEGDTAHDETAGAHDGTVVGDPTWEPDGGQLGGALRLDGINDYVATGVIFSPSDGPFSVFAWIKSEAAGKVILSQYGRHDWLLTDSGGALMTNLKGFGQTEKALYSATVVADGQWHRAGLTWDDRRTLYVDGVSVAEDEPGPPPKTSAGLHIGAGANLRPHTFFSGLIDDVRIYNIDLSAEEIKELAQQRH
jgi:7,8-dihydropterin-6-yl-methyl-4-(beta-D-ribofuranosyl)aminobenzene 5'-phosphate synthase